MTSFNTSPSSKILATQRADFPQKENGVYSWFWLAGKEQILNITIDFNNTALNFLTSSFIAPPFNIDSRTANLITRTGWCRYNSLFSVTELEYCVDIPFWSTLKYYGPSSGTKNTIVAITGTNLVEIRRVVPNIVTQKILVALKTIQPTIDTNSIHFAVDT